MLNCSSLLVYKHSHLLISLHLVWLQFYHKRPRTGEHRYICWLYKHAELHLQKILSSIHKSTLNHKRITLTSSSSSSRISKVRALPSEADSAMLLENPCSSLWDLCAPPHRCSDFSRTGQGLSGIGVTYSNCVTVTARAGAHGVLLSARVASAPSARQNFCHGLTARARTHTHRDFGGRYLPS